MYKYPSVLELSIEQIADGYQRNAFNAEQLTTTYLDRIREADHEYNSMLQINDNALSDARALDDERRRVGSRR